MSGRPTKRVKRERFLPHAYERFGVDMRVDAVTLDAARDVEGLDAERRIVEIDEVDWERARVEGTLRVSPEVVERVFPPSERATPPLRWAIAVRCAATRLRRAVVPDVTGVEVPFAVELAHGDVRGVVELVPYLVRARDTAAAEPGYASRRGDRLASARPWTLRVDRAHDPAGELLDTRYQPFSQDAQLRPYAAAVYRLELSEQPTLWINTDHRRLAAVLEEEGTRGPRARIREVVFDHIGQGVWTQLFVQAALDLAAGELVHPWEDTVLRELLPGVVEARTHHARVALLRAALERGELPEILSRLDVALQARDRFAEHVEKLVEDTGRRA